jgi:hypothetical protein
MLVAGTVSCCGAAATRAQRRCLGRSVLVDAPEVRTEHSRSNVFALHSLLPRALECKWLPVLAMQLRQRRLLLGAAVPPRICMHAPVESCASAQCMRVLHAVLRRAPVAANKRAGMHVNMRVNMRASMNANMRTQAWRGVQGL